MREAARRSASAVLVVVMAALGPLGLCGCSSDDVERNPGGGGAGGGVPSQGFCGDGACAVHEGENTHTCSVDCGDPASETADVQFFADFNSKATEYGQHVRFTYVIWNAGDFDAENVVLPVPIVQNADTTIYGGRHYCSDASDPYACMVDLSYVPGSMRVNRLYHPNRARNSYTFVDTIPVTDAVDDDEGFFDAEHQVLYFTTSVLHPRSVAPEVSGYVWSYELATDGGIAHTPCEQYPLVQNWNWIFADNSPEYMNDIIGHIFCVSPRLTGEVAADKTTVNAGDTITYTVTFRYDDVVLPPGSDPSYFTLARAWLYLNYPEDALHIESIDKPTQAEDLSGFDSSPSAGGVVYWNRQNGAGDEQMAPGDSDTLVVTARVKAGVPTGTTLHVTAKVVSQNTLPYQDVDGEHTATVGTGAAVSCGDGYCTPPEDASSCPQDCPSCVGVDGVTSFGDPACCDGLMLIRAAHPYDWAYGQCYDWEGGGVQLAQGYCTACGDGQCQGKENECNCPEDCGPYCTNWICEPGEDHASCPADC